MEIYYLTQSQLDAIDPTWDYENQGTMYPGWYFWPECCQLPRGPWRTEREAREMSKHWEPLEVAP